MTRKPSTTSAGKRTRKETLESLLADAGLDSGVASVEPLNKDEDGTHSRIHLRDGSRCILRLFATTRSNAEFFREKEAYLCRSLAKAGLPVPRILAAIEGTGGVGGEAPAILLSDEGGTLLEHLFTEVAGPRRNALWSTVGAALRQLHDTDIAFAGPFGEPENQLTTRWFLGDLAKRLHRVKKDAPSAVGPVEQFLSLRPRLRDYLDARPIAIRHGDGWYLPEMLLEPFEKQWRCVGWLCWGYYASVGDPMLDIVGIEVINREWTDQDLPDSFYRAYGQRPDPVCQIIYGAYIRLWRAPAYLKESPRLTPPGGRSPNRALPMVPPPYPIALQALNELPATVDRLRALLSAPR